MIERVTPGSTVKIRISLWDGSAMLTGKTVSLSIERLSDGLFWNGVDFSPGTYTTVAMADLYAADANAHNEGKYEYAFATAATEDVYDWRVKYEEGNFLTYFDGRIVAGKVLLADGAHGGIAATMTLDRILIQATGQYAAIEARASNGAGIYARGALGGPGLIASGGDGDGPGIVAAGGLAGGHGAHFDAGTSSYDGIRIDDGVYAGIIEGNLSGSVGSLAQVIDGETFESLMEAIVAVLAGKAVVTANQVEFKKRDGTTTKVAVTIGSEGTRTSSVIT